jgi:hypothetical protein
MLLLASLLQFVHRKLLPARNEELLDYKLYKPIWFVEFVIE